MKTINGLLFFVLLLTGQSALARVFMFDRESIAPYLKVRAGMSQMGNAPFRWQSASTYGGDDVDLIYGGEFGVYFRTHRLGLSLGVLVHTFDPVTGGSAFDSSGNSLFTVDVEGMAYGPQMTFDIQFAKTETYMWKLILGGGYQFAELESTYNFTATGQPLVGGQTQLTESYKQDAPFALLAISTEFVFSGTTTLSVTAGYHYSFSKDWKYGEGGQNFAGTHAQGGDVLFEDATSKTIDWSYPFIQMGFQFYVDTVR